MSCNSKSSKFCALAWVHRFTNVGGEIQVCCTSEETDNNIYSNDGKKMKIGDAYSDEQILNSSYMKNLRKQLLSGEWPEICGRCKVTEEIGGVSRRVDENRHFASLTGKLLESTAPDGTIPVEVKSADYRLGNLCNLACRMCNPRSSTPWLKYSQAFAKGSQPFSAEELAEFARMNWYESPKFIAYVKTQLPSLEHLHFAGGEPLINPQMEPLLRQCVDLGVAKNITLTYNTNLTKISDEIKALWPEFKAVHLYISIDAFGKLNDYIRHPSRWSVIDANLKDIDHNFALYGIQKAEIMATAQIYNIFGLEELYDYLFENMKNISQIPKLVDLHVPAPLRTQVLPPEFKAVAKLKLENILAKSRRRISAGLIKVSEAGTLDSLVGTIAFLQHEDHSSALADFREYTNTLDKLHKKNIIEYVPELASIMTGRVWAEPFPVEKREQLLKSSSFCALPFVQVSTVPEGFYRPCSHSRKMLDDGAGRPLSVTCDYSETVWNGEAMRTIRKKMLNGEAAQGCEGCRAIEDAGEISERLRSHAQWEKNEQLWKAVRDAASNQGAVYSPPRSFEIKPADWSAIPKFWESLERAVPVIEMLSFAGDKPARIPEVHALLEKCVSSGHAKGIRVLFAANFAREDELLLELKPHFREFAWQPLAANYKAELPAL